MTPEPPRRLGRGLDALLNRQTRNAGTEEGSKNTNPGHSRQTSQVSQHGEEKLNASQSPGDLLTELPLAQIRANPFQPRQEFRPEDLRDLQNSLRVNGLLQPITVRPAPNGSGYELIAGERRFRAASNLGWTSIPALVKQVDDQTLLTLALIENLQRADLDPIEEADGYQRLIDEFQLSNQDVAELVGKDRSTVANAIRLRQLPASVRRMLQEKSLTAGHARALLPLANELAITDLARETLARQLSVREVERRVAAATNRPGKGGASKTTSQATGTTATQHASNPVVREIEEKLRRRFQTSVSLKLSDKDKGEVHISFFSNDDLERLMEIFGVPID